MMVKHFIIMSSSYVDGTRIALDITDVTKMNTAKIAAFLENIRNECGDDVPLSTHFLSTETDEWLSVGKADPFFEEVEKVSSEKDFVARVKAGRVLSGLDVATYILTKVRCTHLALEKLVYFAYADYLCRFGKRLFEDKIYAFTHGPVVDSVYKAYRRSGYKYVEPIAENIDKDVRTEVQEMAARSRILFAVDGDKKLRSINEAIDNYGHLSAGALVAITHKEGSPWSMVDSSKAYQIISDELISEHHAIEHTI